MTKISDTKSDTCRKIGLHSVKNRMQIIDFKEKSVLGKRVDATFPRLTLRVRSPSPALLPFSRAFINSI